MRKALIGLIMAATVLTPVAAQAQDRDGLEVEAVLGEQSEPRPQRADRQERRAERAAARQAQAQAQEPVASTQTEAAPVQVVQRERRDRGGAGQRSSGYQRGWQGPPGTENSRIADRYNRRAQENAIRYGTPEQRRDAILDARQDGRSREQIRDWRRDGREDRRDWRQDRREDRRDWRQDRRDDRRHWNGDRWNRGGWNRGWRNDNRYDWRSWRNHNRHIFRAPRYYAPYRNYNYSRFSIGLLLDRIFYDRRYWIGDPWQYRLPPAYPGTQWVRYYNDVILVDVYTGEVVDVIYDFFW